MQDPDSLHWGIKLFIGVSGTTWLVWAVRGLYYMIRKPVLINARFEQIGTKLANINEKVTKNEESVAHLKGQLHELEIKTARRIRDDLASTQQFLMEYMELIVANGDSGNHKTLKAFLDKHAGRVPKREP